MPRKVAGAAGDSRAKAKPKTQSKTKPKPRAEPKAPPKAKTKKKAPARPKAKPATQPAPEDPPKPDPHAQYAKKKTRERDRQAKQAREGNDIAAGFPTCTDPVKRKRISKSLEAFCLECMPNKFGKSFSADHKKAIAKMERAILHGGNFALAMPRGSGKTTLAIAAVLWAILNGHKRYLAVIGADKKAAAKLLAGIKVALETTDALLDLYPEAVYPIRCLERIPNRCKGQNYNGDATYIEWTSEKIVFASIPNAPSISGAAVEVCGIMGGVRGLQHTTPAGETLRPDIFIVDDPQTNRSARSATMIEERLETITGTLPGLAGPGEEISGFCLCTVIEEDDVADQLLDPEKYPDWQGERFQLVYAWATREDLWEEYGELYREGMATGKGLELANAFYLKNRKAMDAGAKVAWEERFTKREISAIQHAYNLLLKLKDAFWKECQNQPKSDDETEDLLTVDAIAAKVSGFGRGCIPPTANLLTAFIDVHDKLLYWLVLATDTRTFTCHVIDYGAWPEQRTAYFNMSGVSKTLAKVYPKAGREGRTRKGLFDLTNHIATRRYTMPDGTTELPVKLIGLDAAWETRVVQNVALESPHSSRLLPRFGRGINAEDAPFEAWKPKPGERRGIGWKIRPAEGGGRYALIDTNYWKNFTHSRLAMAGGDPGSLELFRPLRNSRSTHRMFAEHCRAERRVESKTNERSLQVWKEKTNKPDNHLFDCLVGAICMAGVDGAALTEHQTTRRPRRKARRKTSIKT